MNNEWLPVEKQIEIIALSHAHNNGGVKSIAATKFTDGRSGVVVHYGNGAVRKIAVDEAKVQITHMATRH